MPVHEEKRKRFMLGWGRRALGAGAMALSMVVALPALAAPVADVDGASLTGGGPGTGSIWELSNGASYKDQCVIRGANSFSPVYEGALDGRDDAFDGGMGLDIGHRPFIDSDNKGTQTSVHNITVGPEAIRGLKVTEKEVAFTGKYAIVRVLAQFKNPSSAPISRLVTYDSAMGSDSATTVRASSDGDYGFSKRDRWVVTSDAADSSSSDVITAQVLGGPGKPRVKIHDVPFSPYDDPPGDGEHCVTAEFNLTVPAHATRALLFFTQLGLTVSDSVSGAMRFNKNRSSFFTGLTSAEKKAVLNWDL
jgi:hypothetical protein